MKRQKPKSPRQNVTSRPKIFLTGAAPRSGVQSTQELENPPLRIEADRRWPQTQTGIYILADIPADSKIHINGPCYIGTIGAGAQVYIVGGPVIVRENIGDNVTICITEYDGQDPAEWFKRAAELENKTLGQAFHQAYKAGKKIWQRSPQSDAELMQHMSGLKCRGQIGRNVTMACFSHVDLGDSADIHNIKVIAGGDIHHYRGLTSSKLLNPQLHAGRDIRVNRVESSGDDRFAHLQAMRDVKADFLFWGAPVHIEAWRNIHVRNSVYNPAILVAGQNIKFTKRPSKQLKAIFNGHCDFFANIMTLQTCRNGVTEIHNKVDNLTEAELNRLVAISRKNARRAGEVKEGFQHARCVEIHSTGSAKGYYLNTQVTDSNSLPNNSKLDDVKTKKKPRY